MNKTWLYFHAVYLHCLTDISILFCCVRKETFGLHYHSLQIFFLINPFCSKPNSVFKQIIDQRCIQVFKFGGPLDPLLKNFLHCHSFQIFFLINPFCSKPTSVFKQIIDQRCIQVFKFGGPLDPLLKNLGVHFQVLGVQLIYSTRLILLLIFDGAQTLARVERQANFPEFVICINI